MPTASPSSLILGMDKSPAVVSAFPRRRLPGLMLLSEQACPWKLIFKQAAQPCAGLTSKDARQMIVFVLVGGVEIAFTGHIGIWRTESGITRRPVRRSIGWETAQLRGGPGVLVL